MSLCEPIVPYHTGTNAELHLDNFIRHTGHGALCLVVVDVECGVSFIWSETPRYCTRVQYGWGINLDILETCLIG